MIEIERKFLCTVDPVFLHWQARERLESGYLSVGTPEVRVARYIDADGFPEPDSYLFTVKSGGTIRREEVEFNISEHNGHDLYTMAYPNITRKTRYWVGRWEIDVYEGKLAGLCVAEVELSSEEEDLPPVPFGLLLSKEVTTDPRLKNKALASLSLDEATRLVTEAQTTIKEYVC